MLAAIFPRNRNGEWISKEEVNSILTHAKTFKSPYTRKCPQRPFENFISILALYPWANRAVYTKSQVALLFEGYSSLVSVLQWHIRKGKIFALNNALLQRLIAAGSKLTDFSAEQKQTVVAAVGLRPYMVDNEDESALSSINAKRPPPENAEIFERVESSVRAQLQSVTNTVPTIKISDASSPIERVSAGYDQGRLPSMLDCHTQRHSHAPTSGTVLSSTYESDRRRVSNPNHLPFQPVSHCNMYPRLTGNITPTARGIHKSTRNVEHSSDLPIQERWRRNAEKAGISVEYTPRGAARTRE